MKFTELSEKSKVVATKEYIVGWLETHPDDEDMNFDTAFDILIWNDDYEFCKNGKIKNET